MRKPFPRLALLPGSAALAAALFAGSMMVQLPVAQASAADANSREITRLINVARAASGKHALNVDVLLASKARDGSIPCPDDAAKSISGRSHDFAVTGKMSHQLRDCDSAGYSLSSTTFVSTLQSAWGYGAVGEILLVNGGYGSGEFLYTYKGASTWTYATTGHAMLGWATSSTHWNIVMGSYDRVGCGAWSPNGSTIYYACLFAGGGPAPSGVVAAPRTSPFSDPLPTPVATPVPTVAPTATPAPIVTPAPVATPVSTPVADPTQSAPDPTDTPYSGQPGGALAGSTTGPGQTPPAVTDAPAAPAEPTASVTTGATSDTTPTELVDSVTFTPTQAASEAAVVTPEQKTDQSTSKLAGAAGSTGDNGTGSSGPGRQNTGVLLASTGTAWLGLFGLLLAQRRRRLRNSGMMTA